jgi:cytochrome c oxidase assembly factor CtaG
MPVAADERCGTAVAGDRFLQMGPVTERCVVAFALVLASNQGRCHSVSEPVATQVLGAWTLDQTVATTLTAAGTVYLLGIRRLWRSAGRGHGITIRAAAAMAAGWVVLVLALTSPIDALGEQLFCMHMLQHELLLLVAAPLLVTGRPLAVAIWAFPPWARQRLGAIAASRPAAALRRWVFAPPVACVLHGATLWLWHAPLLFEWAIAYRWVHTLQHSSFVLSGILFWWVCWASPRARRRCGVASLCQFATMLHSGALGALLAFSSVAWFPAYVDSAPRWGLSPLEDQQLGGLIMWIPGGIAYLVAALALLNRWALSPPVARARPSGATT